MQIKNFVILEKKPRFIHRALDFWLFTFQNIK